jgi:hypothetical protein
MSETRWTRLGARWLRYWRVVMAAGVLAFFRVGLRITRFDRLQRLSRTLPARTGFDRAAVGETAELITRAADVLPGRSSCLSQALALSFLLARRRIPSALVIGVARVDHGHRFHAWVENNGRIVIGAADAVDCVRLVAFE